MTTKRSARRTGERNRIGAFFSSFLKGRADEGKRPDSGDGEAVYRKITALFWVFLTAFILLAFNDYGITYDEPKDHEYGRLLWRFYLSAFQNRDLFAYHDLKIYGGLFEMIAWPLCALSPLDEYATRHLLNALTGAIGILGCFKLGMLLGGLPGAFWSALLLAATPQYIGHMFNNPKDIPYAAGYIWSLYFILLAYRERPGVSGKTLIKIGVALGLTAGVRAGGMILAGVFVVSQAISGALGGGFGFRRTMTRLPIQTGAVLLAAWPVMAFFWPYALINPLSGPYEAIVSFSRFPWEGNILFAGKLYAAAALPPDYIPRLLALQLPEISLLALAGGIWMGARAVIWSRKSRKSSGEYLVLLIAVAAPIIFVISVKSVLYNGMRHFIFVIPPLCCLAGVGLARALKFASRAGGFVRGAAFSGLCAALLWHAAIVARLHPHEIAYFNAFAGGLPGAFNVYELDYWGNSYKELVERFRDNYEKEQKGEPRSCNIYVTGPYDSAGKYLPGYCRMVSGPWSADFAFFLVNTSPPTGTAPVYAMVQRFGVPLAYAIDIRKGRK